MIYWITIQYVSNYFISFCQNNYYYKSLIKFFFLLCPAIFFSDFVQPDCSAQGKTSHDISRS